MLPDAPYLSDPVLAPARHLQRLGQWDLALGLIADVDTQLARDLRAELLFDRVTWRRLPFDEAFAAADQASEPLATFLRTQLAYWQTFTGGGPSDVDIEGTFRALLDDPRMGGLAGFYLGIYLDNVREEAERAQQVYRDTLMWASERGDLLLESFVVRHQSAHATDVEDIIGLRRLSLHLRSALGYRPLTAAAQALLAVALGDTDEAHMLRAAVAVTAHELDIPMLK